MTTADQSESAQHRCAQFLLEHRSDQIAHPGGTLDDHLHRVSAILRDWGYPLPVQLAGLTHATYGTDGFDVALLGLAERAILRDAIGAEAEALVYLYASCDCATVYPQLGNPSVSFTDRFTGTASVPDAAMLGSFVAITAANELDVVAHSHAIADAHSTDLLAPVARARRWLPDSSWWACLRGLAAHVQPSPRPDRADPGIQIDRLDHLVLTVADVQRTLDFYHRVLGMTPVTFGIGRHALSFGHSKINLHQSGQEFEPKAARPTPGSADVCLISRNPLEEVLAYLAEHQVPVEQGPISRTGATGPITSVYVRDPDGNLVEISTYQSGAP